MQDRKSFTDAIREGHQYTLPLHLPPAPKVKADMCRYCHGVHMNVADFLQCREANT